MPDLGAPELDDWLALSTGALPVDRARTWATRPDCGAVVVFTGTVRDHAEGRSGVSHLEYEAYEEAVVPTLREIAAATRRRWPDVARIALWHRVGVVPLGEPSVVVSVSAPHREAAFEAARHAIDTLKETVPIWKREFWEGGDGWGLGAVDVRAVRSAPAPSETGG